MRLRREELMASNAELLKNFRMPGFLEAYLAQGGVPGAEQLPFDERLNGMLQAEQFSRLNKGQRRLLRDSKISMPSATFDRFDWSGDRELNADQIRELSTCMAGC